MPSLEQAHGELKERLSLFFAFYTKVLEIYAQRQRWMTNEERRWHARSRKIMTTRVVHDGLAAQLASLNWSLHLEKRSPDHSYDLLLLELDGVTARLKKVLQLHVKRTLIQKASAKDRLQPNRPGDLRDGVQAGAILIESLKDLLEGIPGLKQLLTVLKEGIDVLLLD